MKYYNDINPVVLAMDNFTPLWRTPWAGSRILRHYKPLVPPQPSGAQVGESWEISMGPEFPSLAASSGLRLDDLIRTDPAGFLGKEYAAGRELSALLVKLLDAGENLSVQIHPSDAYVGLKGDESGKPESWYVLHVEAGAGVYLGFKAGVGRDDIARSLARDDQGFCELLNFVALSPGDFVLVEAGVPHAIGKGVTVLEPQHVSPGRKGVTYRYWDWNRRYGPTGLASPKGNKRPLHVDDALAVTDFRLALDPDWLARSIVHAGKAESAGALSIQMLCGPGDARLQSRWLRVARICGTGASLTLPDWDVLRGLTLVGGELTLTDFDIPVRCGQSVVLPAALRRLRVSSQDAHALLTAVVSPGAFRA